MAMPEKIWAFIGAGFQGSWIESAKPETTEFIRADLVDELVKALEEASAELRCLVNGSHPQYAVPHLVHDGKGGEEAIEPDDSVMIDRVCHRLAESLDAALTRIKGDVT